MATTEQKSPRQRIPAAERRDALIDAAVHEFAHGGLHGTPVDRIARQVGVAQPYVFSLFANKRELFIAAVERCFDTLAEVFTQAASEFDPATAPPDVDVLKAMGNAYVELLSSDRDYLMLQHQAYAACDDDDIRERVRAVLRAARHPRRGTRRRRARADRRVLPLRHVAERRGRDGRRGPVRRLRVGSRRAAGRRAADGSVRDLALGIARQARRREPAATAARRRRTDARSGARRDPRRTRRGGRRRAAVASLAAEQRRAAVPAEELLGAVRRRPRAQPVLSAGDLERARLEARVRATRRSRCGAGSACSGSRSRTPVAR